MPRASFSSRILKSHTSSRRSLRRIAGLGLGFLSLLSVSAAHAGTVNWDGAVADWFSSPSHWSNGATPGAGDDAVNMSTAAMTLGQSTTVNSFFSNGAFTLTGGTFTGNKANSASTLTVNNVFSINNGTINNFTINQGTGGSLVFSGTGNILDNDTINSSFDLSTNANTLVYLKDAVTENGAITVGNGSSLQLYGGGVSLTLGTKGSLTGTGAITQAGGTTLTNNGTVNAKSNAASLDINLDTFSNNATAEATSGGTLNFNTGTLNNAGLLTTTGGGILNITGTLNSLAGGTLNSLGGIINIHNATLNGTLNGVGVTSLVFSGTSNIINGGSILNANLDLATHPDTLVYVKDAVTETKAITLGTTSNGLQLYGGGSNLTLSSTGSLAGFGTVSQAGGTTLTNNGLVNANSSSNALNLNVSTFNNNTVAEATSGATLNLNTDNTNAANGSTLAATGKGSVVSITGTYTGTGSALITASGGGQVKVNNVVLNGTINTDASTALVFSGTSNIINGGSVLNANLDLATHPDTLVYVKDAVTENKAITLGTTSNGLQLYGGGSNLTLSSTGSLSGFGTVSQAGGTTLTSNGLVNANSAVNALNINLDTFSNNSTAEATNGATLNLNTGNINNAGLLTTTGGGILNITGTLNSLAGGTLNSLGGIINIHNATLNGTLNGVGVTSLVFSGTSNIINGGSILNANLDLATHPDTLVYVKDAVTETKAITLGTTSNGLQLYGGGSNLTLSSTGSLAGFGTVSQAGGTTLTNNGTVNANSAGNTLNINTDNFVNAGTTAVQNGAALSVTSANTDSGNILVAKGGTATFTQGVTQTAGLTQVNGTLNSPLTLTGGTLSGSGTVNGNITNSGGTVAAGSPFGTLAVNGAFSQASGALDAVFSSTQSNLLLVSGAVTTGGTLSVSYLGSGAYTGFAPFTFLDYGSLGTEPTNALGLTQYFTNETVLTNNTGLITGQNGFTYELINNTGLDALQLQVVTNGAPVPEASTNLSLGALLALGGLGMWRVKRRTATAS